MTNMILGFAETPAPTYIFVGESNSKTAGWYTMDYANNTKVPIESSALYGVIKNIVMVKKEWKNKPSIKLDIHVAADKYYIIRAGVETFFTRGFLLSARTIANVIKDSTMCISVSKGDQENVMFCRLYHANGNLIKVPWDSEVKLLPIITDLQTRLGVEVQNYKDVMNGVVHNDHTGMDVPKDEPPTSEFEPPAEPPAQPLTESNGQPLIEFLKEASKPPPVSSIKEFDDLLANPEDIKKPEERIPAPIAAAARKLGPEYYATEIEDMITLKQMGTIRSLCTTLEIEDTLECMELIGSDTSDLSVKGADHFIAHLNRKIAQKEN